MQRILLSNWLLVEEGYEEALAAAGIPDEPILVRPLLPPNASAMLTVLVWKQQMGVTPGETGPPPAPLLLPYWLLLLSWLPSVAAAGCRCCRACLLLLLPTLLLPPVLLPQIISWLGRIQQDETPPHGLPPLPLPPPLQCMPPALWGIPGLTSLTLSDIGLGRREPLPGEDALLVGLYELPAGLRQMTPNLAELALLDHSCVPQELELLSAVRGGYGWSGWCVDDGVACGHCCCQWQGQGLYG